MSVYQLELIKDFCGAVEKPLSINQLSTKYKKSPEVIKEDLIKVLNKLHKGNNLNVLLEEFPDIEDTLKKEKRKLKSALNLKRNYQYQNHSNGLDSDDLKCLKFLWKFKDKAVTKDDIKKEGFF